MWDVSFTNDVEWDQLLLCIEPHSCLMNQFLLDNSSMMYNWTYIRGSSGYSKKLPTETLITDKFIHPFVPCLLSHPSSFESSSSSIYFLRKQHYMHPFNKLPVKKGFEGEKHPQLHLWSDGHSLFWMGHYCHQICINNKKSIVEHRSCYSTVPSK